MVRVFANGPWDQGSIPGRVIPKTQKMELDTMLLSPQHYKVRIRSKVEQHPPLYISVIAIKKEAFGSPSTTVANLISIISIKNTYLNRNAYVW